MTVNFDLLTTNLREKRCNLIFTNNHEARNVKRWDSAYIYFISGTGNARSASHWMAEEAKYAGMEVVVQQIDRLENISFPGRSEKTLIGFAFPTHGFNAAPIMLKFIAGFPPRLCRDVFLLNTRAGMKISKLFTPGLSGLALLLPAFILLLKGYSCRGFLPVDLPSNWIPLHPGLKKKVIESIFVKWEARVREYAAKLYSGKNIYRGLWSIPVDILISPLAFGYYIAGRFFLSKTFIANSSCNGCGLCIKECPTSSVIMVRNRPYWKITCESCMRCLNRCPERAIEAAHGMAVVFYLLIITVNGLLASALSHLSAAGSGASWYIFITRVTSVLLTVLIPSFIYLIIHYASGFRPLRTLLKFTSLTTFRFWRRYQPGSKK